MSKLTLLLIIFVISEIIIAFVFAVIAQQFYARLGFDFKSIIKGVVERLFLFIALVNGYAQALTFFSALKLATRLKHSETEAAKENRFNDYYLIGNLASVAITIGYVYVYQNFDHLAILKKLVS